MKTLVLLGMITGLVCSSWGQAGQALRRAREISNQNNVRQGVPSPAPQPAAPLPAGAGTNHAVATQQQSLAALQADLAGFKTGAVASDAQKQQFTVHLARAVRGHKPSLPSVRKLVNSLTAGLSGATLTDEQRGRLALDLDAVLNSRDQSAAQFDKIIADVQAILEVGTLKRNQAAGIANDLKQVGMEIRR
ncbi:MAG TPA: hypothetical protein PKN95_05425 [Verrucomicrobiota bacterium]|nr:hypothetical protein [Verrucomicrobiota bacterium]HNT13528.1 hypothetical protein [Verrucomicrobiota bacterium]